jgi:hypothetical protein
MTQAVTYTITGPTWRCDLHDERVVVSRIWVNEKLVYSGPATGYKPAPAGLMVEQEGRYRGLGWCDAAD